MMHIFLYNTFFLFITYLTCIIKAHVNTIFIFIMRGMCDYIWIYTAYLSHFEHRYVMPFDHTYYFHFCSDADMLIKTGHMGVI